MKIKDLINHLEKFDEEMECNINQIPKIVYKKDGEIYGEYPDLYDLKFEYSLSQNRIFTFEFYENQFEKIVYLA